MGCSPTDSKIVTIKYSLATTEDLTMTNVLNEYLKKRPALGTVAFLFLVVVGHAFWAVVIESNRSFVTVLSDPSFWFITAIFAVPMGLIYFTMAKNQHT